MRKTPTPEQLRQQLAAAHAEADMLEAKIPAAIASGEDETIIGRMRSRRRELVDHCDDLAEALRVLDDEATKAEKAEAAGAHSRSLAAARAAAEAYVRAADAVDVALGEIEKKFDGMRLAGLDLSRALRLAGLSDGGRLANTLKQSLRWAAWKAAPAFADSSQIPRAEFQRRRPLAESARRVIPAIPGE